jgi:hypothetical protein
MRSEKAIGLYRIAMEVQYPTKVALWYSQMFAHIGYETNEKVSTWYQ